MTVVLQAEAEGIHLKPCVNVSGKVGSNYFGTHIIIFITHAHTHTHTHIIHTLGVTDHRVLSNRSMVHVAMEQYDEALKDSTACCYARPFWAKVRVRGGNGRVRMGWEQT